MAFFGDNDGGAMVGLKGEGVAPAVTLAPSAFDFGLQAAGSKSDGHAFAVRNDGAPRSTSAPSPSSAPTSTSSRWPGTSAPGRRLAPGAECLVRVRFAPDSAGAKAAKLRVGSDSGAFVAALSGCRHGGCRPPTTTATAPSATPARPAAAASLRRQAPSPPLRPR